VLADFLKCLRYSPSSRDRCAKCNPELCGGCIYLWKDEISLESENKQKFELGDEENSGDIGFNYGACCTM
jgi:hypothetical protein